MQFENDYFLFDGIDSRAKDIYIISTEDKNSEYDFGLKRSIVTETGVGDVPTFIGVEESVFDIKIQITKCNEVGQPIDFSEQDKYELARWLIKKEPRALYLDDMVYYVIAKDGTRWFNNGNRGYVTLTFQSVSPYCYAPVKTEYFLIDKEHELVLENSSSLELMEYVDIDLKRLSGTWIEFINEELLETFKLENLDETDVNIKVYGEDMLYVQNKDLENKNMRPKVTKDEWLRLTYGSNTVKIRTDGEFYCRITYQEKNPLV